MLSTNYEPDKHFQSKTNPSRMNGPEKLLNYSAQEVLQEITKPKDFSSFGYTLEKGMLHV